MSLDHFLLLERIMFCNEWFSRNWLVSIVILLLLFLLIWSKFQEARGYAEENGLFFMETSAKTAQNVNEVFYEIGE